MYIMYWLCNLFLHALEAMKMVVWRQKRNRLTYIGLHLCESSWLAKLCVRACVWVSAKLMMLSIAVQCAVDYQRCRCVLGPAMNIYINSNNCIALLRLKLSLLQQTTTTYSDTQRHTPSYNNILNVFEYYLIVIGKLLFALKRFV